MKRVVAISLLALLLAGCGGSGADGPQSATLTLDSEPNAVQSGIYLAQRNGALDPVAREHDIVLGLDVSGSMQALDFMVNNNRVNRIAVVKAVVAQFIDERPNDRIGLIAFAGSPYIVSPLTLDHDWLLQNLERVNPGIGDDGTAILNRIEITP